MTTFWMLWFAWAMLSGSVVLGIAIGFDSDFLERFWWVIAPPLWPLFLGALYLKIRAADRERQAEAERQRQAERRRLAREAERKAAEATAADRRLRAAMASVNRLEEQAREAMYAAVFDEDSTDSRTNVAKSATEARDPK